MFTYIIGSQNPVVGKAYAYEISSGSLSIFGENTKYEWYLFKKQKNGSWRDVTSTPKIGKSVTYTFHEPVLGNEFELRGFETKSGSITGTGSAKKQIAKLDVVPSHSKTAQIDKVVLLNRGSKDVNKANYRDTLVAQAFCTAMFDQEIEFQLWEDDASGGGHNAVINKNNHHTRTYKARVNEKGIAEVKIPLSGDERILRQIANKYLMKGDKSEGKNHEYYITASYHGKIQKANQVNVDIANPDYKKDSQKSQPKAPAKKPEQKKTTPQPQKPQPRQDTYKKPVPNNKPATGKNNQSDKDGRIIDVSFKNRAGKNFTTTPKFGETIIVEILTKNVIGKHYYLRVWEDDTIGEHDLLYEGVHKITNDKQLVTFALTKDRQQIGEIGNDPKNPDSGEYRAEWTDHQELFAEIAFADISKESTRLTVEVLEEYKSPEYKSTAKVKMLPKKESKGTCICQEQYKDLVWGGKVSCDFRKKVVEICTQLWPAKPMEMANGLMAVMKVETDGSFKAHQIMGKTLQDVNSLTKDDFYLTKKDGSKTSRAIGLIQFTQAALELVGDFVGGSGFDKLHQVKLNYAKMGEIRQLDKVKKYFSLQPKYNKLKNTPEDIYLLVFGPEGVGKDDSAILYRENIDAEKYRQNQSVDLNKTTRKDDVITRGEILDRYHKSFDEGSKPINKPQKFTCNIAKSTNDKVVEKDIITYHIFAKGEIEKHIPKQIKSDCEHKYKYVYHDKNNKEHNICTAEWHKTMEKIKGTKPGFLPKHSKIIEDKNVKEGQTQRRVKYENGDVAEYGYNKGKHFWNLYAVTGKKIELVKMPEGLNYNEGAIKVNYKFSDTERKYTHPGALAGFIGALAECGFSEVTTTGSCFKEATCFPSVKHVNGESIDTKYMSVAKETKFVKAMAKFKFNKQITGLNINSYPDTAHQSDHEDHLHSGFNVNSIIIIREK